MGACKLPLAPCVQERTRAHDIASIAHRPAALFKWGKDSIHRLSAVTLHPAQSVHADRGSVHRLLRRTTLPRPFRPCRDGQETTIEARMSHTFRPSPEERAHMTLRHRVSSRPRYPRGQGQRSQAVALYRFTLPVPSKPARAHPHNVASSRFLPRSVQVDCCAITLHPAYSAHARKGSVHKLLN